MIRHSILRTALLVALLLSQGCSNLPLPVGNNPPPSTQNLGEVPASPRDASQPPSVPGQATTTSSTATAPAGALPVAQKNTIAGNGTVVRPKVDQENTQTGLISASKGGKIDLKGANGVSYTLEIPKDALLSDEVITMTPVAQIDGLPLSRGLLGAVDLQPEGMRLVKPATLTIQVPAAFKTADLMGFAYKGQGTDFHLYPVSGKGNIITANIMHFSSYGGGQGTQADSQAQQNNQSSDAESQLENNMGGAMDNARRTGGNAASREAEDALRNAFNGQVGPNLTSAETNDQAIDSAIAQYLSWAQQVALLGMEDRFQSEFAKAARSMEKGLKNAIDKASQRCVQNLDWEEGLKMISRARTAQLLNGLNGFSGQGMDLQDIRPKLDQCWTFRLDYESIVKWELDDNMDITAHVKSQVTLNMREDMTAFEGKAPLEYVDSGVEWRGESYMMNAICDIQMDTTDTTLSVSPMILSMNLSTSGPANVRGLLDPGDTTENWSWKCGTGSGTIQTNSLPTVGWSTGFKKVNKKREFYESTVNGANQGKPKYYYYNFASVGKPVIARETGTGTESVEQGKVTEEYTIDIVHAPKGSASGTGSSSQSSADPPRKPVGPKTTDSSALPQELKSIPGPPNFAVVEDSTDRIDADSFLYAEASWWGTGSISQTAAFYRGALSANWEPDEETVRQSGFEMTFINRADSKLVLNLEASTSSGGIKITESLLKQK